MPPRLRSGLEVYFQGADLEYLGQLLQRKANIAQLLVSDRASMLEAVDSGKYISLSSTSSDKVSEVSKYTYLPVVDLLHPSEACCIKPRLYKLTTREKQMLRFYKEYICGLLRGEEPAEPKEQNVSAWRYK